MMNGVGGGTEETLWNDEWGGWRDRGEPRPWNDEWRWVEGQRRPHGMMNGVGGRTEESPGHGMMNGGGWRDRGEPRPWNDEWRDRGLYQPT